MNEIKQEMKLKQLKISFIEDKQNKCKSISKIKEKYLQRNCAHGNKPSSKEPLMRERKCWIRGSDYRVGTQEVWQRKAWWSQCEREQCGRKRRTSQTAEWRDKIQTMRIGSNPTTLWSGSRCGVRGQNISVEKTRKVRRHRTDKLRSKHQLIPYSAITIHIFTVPYLQNNNKLKAQWNEYLRFYE